MHYSYYSFALTQPFTLANAAGEQTHRYHRPEPYPDDRPFATHLLGDHTNQLPCFHAICHILRHTGNQRNLTIRHRG